MGGLLLEGVAQWNAASPPEQHITREAAPTIFLRQILARRAPSLREEELQQDHVSGVKSRFFCDFALPKYIDLGGDTRHLCSIGDRWMYQDKVGPVLAPTPGSVDGRRVQLGTWRNANYPVAEERMAPLLRNAM